MRQKIFQSIQLWDPCSHRGIWRRLLLTDGLCSFRRCHDSHGEEEKNKRTRKKRNAVATLSARRPARICTWGGSMTTRVASHDCEGQSEPIRRGGVFKRRNTNKNGQKGSVGGALLLSLFLLLCQKNESVRLVLFFVCLFSWFFHCLTVIQAWFHVSVVDVQNVQWGHNRNADDFTFVFVFLQQMLLLHCEAKALRGI